MSSPVLYGDIQKYPLKISAGIFVPETGCD